MSPRFSSFSKFARRAVLGAVGVVAVLGAAAPQTVAQTRAAAPREFVMVVHQDNPLTTIERDDLSKMFLKRIGKWPNGMPVEPVDLSVTEVSRIAFTTVVHKKSVGAIRAFWQQQIFSGRDVPPPEKGTEAQVIEHVKFHPNAIGYVSVDAVLAPGIKVLTIQGN